jgi:methionine-rich copper-binding protein CopC
LGEKSLFFSLTQPEGISMKMFKGCFIALIITMVSAFAHASVNTATVEAQYELSQAPVDLGVQSANDISFEVRATHSEAFQVEKSEAIKPQRSITEQFLLVDSKRDQLIVVNEVGWQSSYAF